MSTLLKSIIVYCQLALGFLYYFRFAEPGGLCCCPFLGGSSVVVDSLLIVTPNVGGCNCSMFCCTLLYIHPSFAIVLMAKRELIALLSLSS